MAWLKLRGVGWCLHCNSPDRTSDSCPVKPLEPPKNRSLTPNQLDLISKVIIVLNPVEEITKSVFTNAASVSPFIRALQKTLEDHSDDHGVRTMKSDMLTLLNRRYVDVETDLSLVLATLLDPRFKDKFFSGPQKRAYMYAKEHLDQKIEELASAGEPKQPSPKRPKYYHY